VTDFLDTPLEEIDLSVRTRHCLLRKGIRTLREASHWREHDLLRIENFGRKSLNELKQLIAAQGGAISGGEPKFRKVAVDVETAVYQALLLKASNRGTSIELEARRILTLAVQKILDAASDDSEEWND
jgi:hypothetical protein